MRVFAALVPPDHAVEDLADFLAPRRDDPAARALSWSRPESWHVSLAFMESAAPNAVDLFIERLGEGTLVVQVPPLQVSGGGAFPVVERATVLYASIPSSDALTRLSERVRSAAAVTGCAPDGRAFVPHLTLARSRRPIEATRWVRVLDTYRGPSWEATEVSVIESHLRSRGPRYTTLAQVPFHLH